MSRHLEAHLQPSSGFGESMIDVNQRQAKIGPGVSLVEWL
ncbi:MAG: phospholipase A [Burkholderiales bacterium]